MRMAWVLNVEVNVLETCSSSQNWPLLCIPGWNRTHTEALSSCDNISTPTH